MLKINGSNYGFNNDKEIVDVDSGELLECKDNVCLISIYGKVYTKPKKWLYAYAKLGIWLHKDYTNQVENIAFYPIDLKSHGSMLDTVAVFKKPVYYKKDNSFRLTPLFPNLAINKSGVSIRLTTDELYGRNEPVKVRHYSSLSFRMGDGTIAKMLTYRIIALAWCKNDNFLKRPIVDHKDGNRDNNHASNLEWVSFAENNRRACAQGLKSDNLDVKVMDYKTGKVYIFGSMTEACEFMGRGRINEVARYCERRFLVNGRYQIKLLNDDSPWDYDKDGNRITEPTELELAYNAHKNPSKGDYKYQVYVLKDKRIINTNRLKETAKELGVSLSLMNKCLRCGPTEAYSGISVRRYSDAPWPKIVKKAGVRNQGVLVKNLETGEENVLPSLRAASLIVKRDRKTIQKAIKNDTEVNGYKVSYI